MTKKRVTRSTFTKMKSTSPLIVDIMTRMVGGKPIMIGVDNDVEDVDDLSVGEPVEPTIIPDKDVLDRIDEIHGDELGSDEEEDEPEFEVDPSSIDEVELVRRSTRVTAGKTSKFQDNLSSVTTSRICSITDAPEVGMSLANLSVKNALETHGKMAYEAIKDELTQLFITKAALKLVKWEDIPTAPTKVRSHMFLKLKVDANNHPEKLKARLVADESTQDRSKYKVYEVSAPTAALPSIMNVLKIAV